MASFLEVLMEITNTNLTPQEIQNQIAAAEQKLKANPSSPEASKTATEIQTLKDLLLKSTAEQQKNPEKGSASGVGSAQSLDSKSKVDPSLASQQLNPPKSGSHTTKPGGNLETLKSRNRNRH